MLADRLYHYQNRIFEFHQGYYGVTVNVQFNFTFKSGASEPHGKMLHPNLS